MVAYLSRQKKESKKLEDRAIEIHCLRTRKKMMKKNKQYQRDIIECTNMHIMKMPEGEERERMEQKIFEEIKDEKNLMVLALVIKSLIHFELIFVYGVK